MKRSLRHSHTADCPLCGPDEPCKYAPIEPCPRHPAFEVDNCPGCGTATKIG